MKDRSWQTSLTFITLFACLSYLTALGCATSTKSNEVSKEIPEELTIFYSANTSGFLKPSG